MKRLRGCVDAEADERERAGIAEREGGQGPRPEHRRQLVAAHPAQDRVGEPGEDRRVHGDEQQHRGGDSGRDRGQLRSLADQQRRDEQRAEQRERGLVGHARERHPGRDSGGRALPRRGSPASEGRAARSAPATTGTTCAGPGPGRSRLRDGAGRGATASRARAPSPGSRAPRARPIPRRSAARRRGTCPPGSGSRARSPSRRAPPARRAGRGADRG